MRVNASPCGGTLFHQPWLLDAASRGRWDQVEVERDGRVVARMPFVVNRRYGLRAVDMPMYARVAGPVLDVPPAGPRRQLEFAVQLIEELHSQLPPHDRLRLTMAPEHDHTRAYLLAGLPVEVGCTFRMPPDEPSSEALAGMKGATRRDVVKSFEHLDHKIHTDLDEFLTVAHHQIRDQAAPSRYDFELVTVMFEAAVQRDQAVVVSTFSESGQNMGSAVLLHDDDVVYLWLTARRLARGNRAYARMIWEAFQFARERGLTLDLDGYSSARSARYLANFGGAPCPRNRVTDTNLRADGLNLARFAAERLLSR